MRVVMVAHSFPRFDGDVAGAFVGRLAQALAARGHAVTAIAPADHGERGAPTLGRVAVRRVRYAAPARETLAYQGTMHRVAATNPLAAMTFLGLVRALAGAIGEECRAAPVDVIHAHWWVPGGAAAALAQRRGRPFVVTLHGTDVALSRKIPGGSALMAAVLRRAAAVTAVSSALADAAARALRRPAGEIPLTPMPLAPVAVPPGNQGERRGVVFVGRLTRQKRVGDLLEALALLARRGRRLDLTVVGDGPERPALERRAAADDLAGTVTFVGAVPPEAVAAYLASKRLCVLPSVDEGLGLVVAEALVAGVPVVATRSGGIPDLLTDPEAGELVPPGDPAALADAMSRVATEERYLAGALRAGRALLERLSPDAVAANVEGIYGAVLSRRSRA
ncbi:MAG TPA: glycosyltransferase [Gemmatimonadales bacterium]|nr:glycosyltransferase [Gemmatimonadales bacterium]